MRRRIISFVLLVAMIVSIMPTASVFAAPDAQNLSAADLRAALTRLAGEHVILAMAATNAAVNGSDAEFQATANALDQNSIELADTIGLVYGQDARDAFLPLWRSHIGFFVDYTQAAAAGDEAGKQEAMENLAGYRNDFGAFLSGANPNVTKDAVAQVFGPHTQLLTDAIDAQVAGDHATAYSKIREAYQQATTDIAKTLAVAIDQQFPDQFSGDADSPAADLRATLTRQLGEHVALADMATNAALQGRQAEFEAVATALDGNSVDLSMSIASVYGEDAGDAFLPLWRTHIGFFVDYTQGAAAGDQAQMDTALQNLQGYRQDFAAFITGANPNLTTDAVTSLLTPHVQLLTASIDAQANQDFETAFGQFREAYAQAATDIAGGLSGAIVQQFPDTFPTTMMPEQMPDTGRGGESSLPWMHYLLIGIVAALGLGYTMTRRLAQVTA